MYQPNALASTVEQRANRRCHLNGVRPTFPAAGGRPANPETPSGRPKAIVAVAELARQYTTEAVETLVDIMRDKKPPAKRRVPISRPRHPPILVGVFTMLRREGHED